VDDPGAARDRRTVTPAIVVSGVFVAACAVFAIAFVSARGGLQMPIAATLPPVAFASPAPSDTLSPTELPSPDGAASIAPPAATVPPEPTIAPTNPPTPRPTKPPFALPTLAPGDPLLALPRCADHPACVEYTVAHNDTLSSIISRYRLDIDVLEALNPGRLSNPSLIVTGELLYLGRSPLARLEPCSGGEACVLYVVQSGDTISQIAARYLLTSDAILAANPGLPRPIVPGQEIKLPA
jgi:nucleoid-associated protein YgaU